MDVYVLRSKLLRVSHTQHCALRGKGDRFSDRSKPKKVRKLNRQDDKCTGQALVGNINFASCWLLAGHGLDLDKSFVSRGIGSAFD